MRELINNSKLTINYYFKQSSVKCLEKTVDCYCCPMRMMEWSNRLRYSWFVAVRSSARILVSHLSERGLYFLLNLRACATDWRTRFAGGRGTRQLGCWPIE